MMTKDRDRSVVPSHIEDDDLISYLDGEIDAAAHAEAQAHLESCWACRRRLKVVERSIENFLQIRQLSLLPPEIPPSGPAVSLFRERLSAHRAAPTAQANLRAFLPDVRNLLHRFSSSLNLANCSLRTQLAVARITVAVLLVSIVSGFVLLSGRFQTVSASELLRLSMENYEDRLGSTYQPVVHQSFQVKQKSRNSAGEQPATWEIWNDVSNSRVRLTGSSGDTQAEAEPAVITDLRAVLQENGMDEHRPLYAGSYKAWSDSLTSKNEEVVRGTNSNGTQVLTIVTIPEAPVAAGRIVEARLALRASDYGATELYLRTKTADGEAEFQLIQSDFAVVSLRDVDPSVFSSSRKVEVASQVGASPKVGAGANSAESPGEATVPEAPDDRKAVATTATEIEVLNLLNTVGADISEQITVARTAGGRLLVDGLVESAARKNQILHALSPVRDDPSVTINIRTIEEAALELARQNRVANPSAVDRVEVQKGTLPVDSDLRAYFARNGRDPGDEIPRFASRAVNRSQAALFQASALKRLANRFTSGQLKTLDPAARAKWLSMVKGYAAAVRRETSALRSQLEPVFGEVVSGGVNENLATDEEMIRAAGQLYELAAANDRVVRSAFTLSSGNASVSPVKSQQFRNSLGAAENLAAAIEKLR
jgi:hypothetical protein